MKLKILVICLIFLVPLSAFGDEKRDLAKEIMEVTKVREMLDQMKGQAEQIQHQVLAQFNIPQEKMPMMVDFQNRLNDKIFEIMSYDEMEKEFLELFTSTYTLEELKGLAAFYKSPVGQSLIEKQPILMEKAMRMSQKRIQLLIPEIQRMTAEFKESLGN